MARLKRERWLLGCVLALSGCAEAPKLTDMEHPQHGIVPREHPAFAADLNDCATPVYARGLVVNGQRVSDRPAATAAYLAWLRQTYTYGEKPETVPPATMAKQAPKQQAPVKSVAVKPASQPSNPSLVTGSTPAASQAEPQFVKDYFAYEKATWDCVRAKGWTEMRG